MLSAQTISQFKDLLRGQLILPSDAIYDQARKVFNGAIDKRPAMILQCADVADVISGVNFARDQQLLIAVKAGGHNGAGLATCDGGLVLDLCRMKGIHVDAAGQRVRAEAGCLLADLDHATHAFGLAVPAGVFAATGIAGLTLGGGLGHLTRKYGLSIDNLLEVSMVLADGSYVQASAESHPELFWAVRGGGGNFGVVVSFLFRAQPVSMVYGGPMLWEIREAKVILQWYREFIKGAPEDINGFFAFLTVPPVAPFPEHYHHRKMCAITWCHAGTMEDAAPLFEQIRKLNPPAVDFTGPIPFPVLQGLFDPLSPAGMQWYWKADYVRELSDEAIDLHMQHSLNTPSPLCTVHLYPVNGAASRVDKQATAWHHRDATWAMVIAGIDEHPSGKDAITSWAKDYWTALHPFASGGGYVNFMMDEGQESVRASYGANYSRLASVKAKYDPGNLFRVNQNIKPQKTGT